MVPTFELRIRRSGVRASQGAPSDELVSRFLAPHDFPLLGCMTVNPFSRKSASLRQHPLDSHSKLRNTGNMISVSSRTWRLQYKFFGNRNEQSSDAHANVVPARTRASLAPCAQGFPSAFIRANPRPAYFVLPRRSVAQRIPICNGFCNSFPRDLRGL